MACPSPAEYVELPASGSSWSPEGEDYERNNDNCHDHNYDRSHSEAEGQSQVCQDDESSVYRADDSPVYHIDESPIYHEDQSQASQVYHGYHIEDEQQQSPIIYPSGLEWLWREVPAECKKLIAPQDVPYSARARGYFTVCELLVLKRLLIGRMNGEAVSNVPATSKRSAASSHLNFGAPAKTARIEYSTADYVVAGVGGVIKQAMRILDDNQVHGQYQVQPSQSQSSPSPCSSTCSDAGYYGRQDCYYPQPNAPTLTQPPPPYRTVTIVLKILQIGSYLFRSFSDINPNRCRVLFNTQHFLYECQLPIVPPSGESFIPLRKLLTIDIRFDQISMIKFGIDKLYIRVEGAPQMTVSYNSVAPEDMQSAPISPQDEFLLDQIEKGQLKLSPCHQLYFLNERLVHMLQSQLREHPMFSHIISDLSETGAQLPPTTHSSQSHFPTS